MATMEVSPACAAAASMALPRALTICTASSSSRYPAAQVRERHWIRIAGRPTWPKSALELLVEHSTSFAIRSHRRERLIGTNGIVKWNPLGRRHLWPLGNVCTIRGPCQCVGFPGQETLVQFASCFLLVVGLWVGVVVSYQIWCCLQTSRSS